VIHRDLKPGNVFVLDDTARLGACKVIDFGIAKATDVGDRDHTLTRTGVVFGTPAYMSPEQARGEALDGRADIYALGCIFHEMLTGRRLFTARTPAEILYRQLFESPLPPSAMTPDAGIPPAIDAIVLRCLLKDPALRFQRMTDVVESIAAALRGESVAAPPPEVLPVPPAALQARYGSGRTEPAPVAGRTVPAAFTPVAVEPDPPPPRGVLRALGWIGGGVALGLALVAAAVLVHRTYLRRDAPAMPPAAVGTDDSAAKAYIDDLPRVPDTTPALEPEDEAPAIAEPPPAKAEPPLDAKPPPRGRRGSAPKPDKPAKAPGKPERKSGDELYSIFDDE
jgi:serine/threonine-protein kinase